MDASLKATRHKNGQKKVKMKPKARSYQIDNLFLMTSSNIGSRKLKIKTDTQQQQKKKPKWKQGQVRREKYLQKMGKLD